MKHDNTGFEVDGKRYDYKDLDCSKDKLRVVERDGRVYVNGEDVSAEKKGTFLDLILVVVGIGFGILVAGSILG